MENKDQPAFPVNEEITDRIDAGAKIYTGLSKREKVAAMCLQGLCASDFRGSMEAFARKSVEAADALLAELSKS